MNRNIFLIGLVLVALACASFGGGGIESNRSRDPRAVYLDASRVIPPGAISAFLSQLGLASQTLTDASWTVLIATDTQLLASMTAVEATNTQLLASMSAVEATDTQLLASMTAVEATNTQLLASVAALVSTDTQLLASVAEIIATQSDTISSFTVFAATDTQLLASVAALVSTDTQLLASMSAVEATDTQLLASVAEIIATQSDTISSFTLFAATDTQLLASVAALVSTDTQLLASVAADIASMTLTRQAFDISSPAASINGSTTQEFSTSQLNITQAAPNYSSSAIEIESLVPPGIRWADTNDGEQFSAGMIGNSGAGYYGIWASSTNSVPIDRTSELAAFAVTSTGYVGIGSGAVKIRTGKVSETTAAAEGGGTNIALPSGVVYTKIISMNAVVYTGTAAIPPGYGAAVAAEFEYNIGADSTQFFLNLATTNSGNLLSKAFTIFYVYEE